MTEFASYYVTSQIIAERAFGLAAPTRGTGPHPQLSSPRAARAFIFAAPSAKTDSSSVSSRAYRYGDIIQAVRRTSVDLVIGVSTTFDFATKHPITGELTAAIPTPVLILYEGDNDTPITVTGGVVSARAGSVGLYRYTFTPQASDGIETGKSYNLWAFATVGGVTDKQLLVTFVARATSGYVSYSVPTENTAVELEEFDTDTLTSQDVTTPKVVYSYTADADKTVAFQVAASSLAGGGWYLLCTTVQLGGVGDPYQSPTRGAKQGAGTDTVAMMTAPTPVTVGDVVKVYFQGLPADTSVGIVVTAYQVVSEAVDAIGALHDFDPANDVVAHVTLVDTVTDLSNAPDLSGVALEATSQSILSGLGALNDFDPATDTVARVTLVDTVTDLSNAPDLSGVALEATSQSILSGLGALNDFDPANDIVAHVALVDVVTGLSTDPWDQEALDEYPEGSAGNTLYAIKARIEEQVPDGPVVVIPPPDLDIQTTAWCLCVDQNGNPEPGVKIYVRIKSGGASPNAYDSRPASATSNSDGVASVIIPRDATLTFEARRGNGAWVTFNGEASETLELPSTVGTP